MQSSTLSMNRYMTNLRGLIKTMRPQQWVKNIIIYAALVFDGRLFDLALFGRVTLVVLLFSLISSSVYIMNDLADIEKDRHHPRKRNRPLASGQLHPRLATAAAIVLGLAGIGGAWLLDPLIAAVLVIYLLQNIAYSAYLKHVVIIDVMVLSLGFLLRVLAGALAAHVSNFSPWLYVCVGLLALFLGFGKRRHEITLLADGAAAHRASLSQYNLPLLDQIIGIVTASMVIAYTFYSFEARTAIVGGGRMLLTVPFVLYFVFRYLYLIHVEKKGGAPDELLMSDRPLLINSALWALAVLLLIYF
ncbi:MAG: decaprenyl-phosphate phosphoribosyltransferase [Caldilineaceae bacterium]|nr:decaprenyl-phosphate phosphoribosyltransferase [Caldilineaceae bacterium]